MGMNLQSCCHICKKKVFHFRGREQETILAFYKAHYWCMRKDKKAVETLEDQVQEAAWMADKEFGGYEPQWEFNDKEHKYIIK